MKNAGRQRSSRFGYLLPLVLLRNSLADYTALISTTLALCPGLWEGSSPPLPPPPRRVTLPGKHIWREVFPPDLKILQGKHFLEESFFSFSFFIWANSYCRGLCILRNPWNETGLKTIEKGCGVPPLCTLMAGGIQAVLSAEDTDSQRPRLVQSPGAHHAPSFC